MPCTGLRLCFVKVIKGGGRQGSICVVLKTRFKQKKDRVYPEPCFKNPLQGPNLRTHGNWIVPLLQCPKVVCRVADLCPEMCRLGPRHPPVVGHGGKRPGEKQRGKHGEGESEWEVAGIGRKWKHAQSINEGRLEHLGIASMHHSGHITGAPWICQPRSELTHSRKEMDCSPPPFPTCTCSFRFSFSACPRWPHQDNRNQRWERKQLFGGPCFFHRRSLQDLADAAPYNRQSLAPGLRLCHAHGGLAKRTLGRGRPKERCRASVSV